MGTRDKNRGVAPVIGFILIFAFIVASLGLFQTFIVPDQNAELEQNHAAQIDDDFARLHSGVLNAVESNENYTATIKMGVQYPARALALNPSNPQGSVRTEEVSKLSNNNEFDTNGNGNDDPFYTLCDKNTRLTTKRLVYTPNYQYSNGYGNHTFENAITSQNVDGRFAEYKQALVRGDTIHLRPITAGSIDQTASGSESVEFRTGKTGIADWDPSKPGNDNTLTLPTKLKQDQWDTLADDNPSIVSASVTGDSVEVEFKDKAYTIKCTPIGINEDPNNQPNFAQPPSPTPPVGSKTINPPSPVILTESKTTGTVSGSLSSLGCQDSENNCIVKLKFEHTDSTGDDWEIKRIRYHYYSPSRDPGSASNPNYTPPPSSVIIYDESNSCATNTYDYQASYTNADNFGEFEAGDSKTLYLNFQDGSNNFASLSADGAIITMKIQNQQNSNNVRYLTYFMSLNSDTSVDTSCD